MWAGKPTAYVMMILTHQQQCNLRSGFEHSQAKLILALGIYLKITGEVKVSSVSKQFRPTSEGEAPDEDIMLMGGFQVQLSLPALVSLLGVSFSNFKDGS